MTKLNSFILVIASVLIISLVLDVLSNEVLFEIRNKTLEIMLGGLVQSLCIIIITILLTIKFRRIKFWVFISISIFVSLPVIVFALLWGWLSIAWPSTIKNDMAIFKKESAPIDYVIFQYYETGIGGNPHTRVIRTTNYELPIRLFEKINNKLKPDTLSFESINWKEKLPQHINFEKNTFLKPAIFCRLERISRKIL